MTGLYGPNSSYVGIHHTKTICFSGPRCTTLWIGSANFTRASAFNHEIMLKFQELHELNKPRSSVLLTYLDHFERLFALADWSTSFKPYEGIGVAWKAWNKNGRNRDPDETTTAPPPLVSGGEPVSGKGRRNKGTARAEWGERTDPPTVKAAPPIPCLLYTSPSPRDS